MIGRVQWRFANVGSTQQIAFHLAELGACHGTVVRADYQSAGRGRMDRRWESPRGSALMFSVLLRPQRPMHQLGTISISIAQALASVFADLSTDPVHIKWPNDVLVDGKKVSGILVQSRTGLNPVAVLGIGINIQTPKSNLLEGATSLHQYTSEPVDPDALFSTLLDRIESAWSNLKPELTDRQIGQLDSQLWLKGDMVSILDADREIEGHVLGIAESGGLRLRIDGHEREIVAGEIRRGPRPIRREN